VASPQLVNIQSKENQNPTKPSKYRPEIDGLRAFAVIAVIINHFNKDILPSGYLGVDIFFVISGFVITSSLLGRESKNFGDFLSGFYERRIKRLVPALVVFVLATSLLICLFNPNPQLALRTGIASLFGLSNLYLLRQSTDYFAEATELNPFVHTWSLGVEEQFYLLFPFLIWFSGFGRQTARGARNLFWIVGTLSIASVISYVYLSQVNQPASYFLMPPRFWEMSAGCLVFLALHRRAWIGDHLQKIPPLLLGIAIIGVLFLPVSLAVPATFSIVVLTGLLIGSLRPGNIVFNFLTLDKVVYVGLISYSLYLWHWGVLSISRWTIGIHWWSVLIQLGLMFGIAIASYKYIENPFRRSSWAGQSLRTISQGIAINFGAVAFIFVLSRPLSEPIRKIQASINPPKFTTNKILQQKIYCHLPNKSSNPINDCLKRNVNTRTNSIFIIGDSHASNHYPSIKSVSKEFGLDTRVLIDWGLINSLLGKENCEGFDPCIENSWNKHLSFFSENLKAGDVILFSWFRSRVVADDSANLPREVDANKISFLEGKLIDLAKLAKEKKAKLILVDDIPMVCQPDINYTFRIIVKGKIEECTITKDVSKSDRIGLTSLYSKLANTYNNVLCADFHDALCEGDQCSVLEPGSDKLLYGDGIGHFTSEYPNPLTAEWRKYLSSIER